MSTALADFYDRINPLRDLQADLARCAGGDPIIDENGWRRRCPQCDVFYCKKAECMHGHYQSTEHARVLAQIKPSERKK